MKCSDCPNEALPDITRCLSCKNKCNNAQKKLRDGRKALGLCVRCGSPATTVAYCADCVAVENARARARNKTRRKSGKCTRCGDPKVKGKTKCLLCLEECNKIERARALKKKLEVIAGYGGRCSCCFETNPVFLSIDHINNDGKAHREEFRGGIRFYMWIIKTGFPQDLRLLCFNCNLGRQVNGGICPHQEAR